MSGSALSLFVRLAFASALLPFFLNTFQTKVDDYDLAVVAYVQILPAYLEAISYDPSLVPTLLKLVVLAELVLPVVILLGLGTRLSALGMIRFLVVMS
jgi:putative oxidoreductase